ncbi:hypothetical protein L2E82_38912 [Cichorium intybus]|uniref:Uncharacterized protein n=1 Tax=Cichorium intybus TaxID=13427 RepID=A0ACB9AH40_CICIN|nr:hypothetical protein L2E82_38912 [Cichorium intybus]
MLTGPPFSHLLIASSISFNISAASCPSHLVFFFLTGLRSPNPNCNGFKLGGRTWERQKGFQNRGVSFCSQEIEACLPSPFDEPVPHLCRLTFAVYRLPATLSQNKITSVPYRCRV